MFFNRYRYRPSLQLCLSNTWQEKGRTGERADEEEGSSLGFLAFLSMEWKEEEEGAVMVEEAGVTLMESVRIGRRGAGKVVVAPEGK